MHEYKTIWSFIGERILHNRYDVSAWIAAAQREEEAGVDGILLPTGDGVIARAIVANVNLPVAAVCANAAEYPQLSEAGVCILSPQGQVVPGAGAAIGMPDAPDAPQRVKQAVDSGARALWLFEQEAVPNRRAVHAPAAARLIRGCAVPVWAHAGEISLRGVRDLFRAGVNGVSILPAASAGLSVGELKDYLYANGIITPVSL